MEGSLPTEERRSRLNPYLNADQLHVLANAFGKVGHSSGSKLISRKGVPVSVVEQLFIEGYLSKKGRRYFANRRTEVALEDHGFDLSEIAVVEPAETPIQKISKEKKLEKHILSERAESTMRSRAEIQAVLLKRAKDKALAGDPWDYVRRQWPELVIRDDLDRRYFEKHCTRKHALDLRLDDAQVELIDYAFDPSIREIAIKGSTSPGKGFATALLLNIRYTLYENDRITLLSQSTKHAKDVMFAEMVTWRKKMRYPDGCETLAAGIKDNDEPKHFVAIANPETGEGLSGGHGAHVTFTFDEASSVPPELPINARKQANLIIYISNPRVLSGFFYDLYPKVEPDKNQVIVDKGIKRACLTFGGHGALNVRAKRLSIPYGPPGGLEGETIDGEKFFIAEGDKVPEEYIPHTRPLIPGQMDYAKYKTIMLSPNETERAWSGEGKFPPEDADFQIVVPSWLKEPCAMWNLHKDKIEVTALGLDLAASVDGDETVLVAGGPLGIKKIFRTKKSNSMETLSWVVQCCKGMGFDLYSGEVPIAVDAIGAGGNVIAEIMEKNGAIVYAMKGNRTAANPSLYSNVRAELYGVLGVRLDPNSSHADIFMIPDDDKLKEELTAHEKHYTSDMTRFQATPKVRSRGSLANVQPIKEKIGRSPDTSDAVVLCHWAILDSAHDGSVVDQFNPSEALDAYRKTETGSVLEGRASGEVSEVTQDDFDEQWGKEPTTIEDEMAGFRKAMESVRKSGSGFMGVN